LGGGFNRLWKAAKDAGPLFRSLRGQRIVRESCSQAAPRRTCHFHVVGVNLERVALSECGHVTIMKNTFIDRSKTALVVIDLQKGVVGRQTAPHASDLVVKNAAALAEACRKNGMPVFLVRVALSPDGKNALHPVADAPMQFQKPPPDWTEIVPGMGPKAGDLVITKRQWGAFYGTELDLELRRRGITAMILCGISTNIGVESTARFAYEYGYNQVFAEDAMAALSAEEHALTVTKIFPRIGLVRKTRDILADLSND
jgi:nicotinamidase-related amidase